MRYLPRFSMTGLCAALCGCNTEPTACADVLTAVTTSVVNGTGRPLAGLSVTDTVSRTGAVLHVSAGSPADTLPTNGIGRVPIFRDDLRSALGPTGDEVVAVVTAEGHSGSGRYRLAFDGCVVRKVAGPDTLVVP